MDQQTDIDLDQVDEQILTYDVSDEAMEAAAGGTVRGAYISHYPHVSWGPPLRCC